MRNPTLARAAVIAILAISGAVGAFATIAPGPDGQALPPTTALVETLPIRGWEYTVAFHNAYRDLAQRYGVTLVPFILMNVIGKPELMQPDRAHPNADGARVIAENIWPYLQPLLPQPV